MERTSTKLLSVTAAVLAVLVPVALVMSHFSAHALPGTTVGGLEVGGKSREEVSDLLEDAFLAQTVQLVTPTGEVVEATYEQLGVSVDTESLTDAVFERNGSLTGRAAGLFSAVHVTPVVDVEHGGALAYLEANGLYQQTDADYVPIAFDAASAQFVEVEPQELLVVDTESLHSELSKRLTGSDSGPVSLQYQVADHAPTLAEAQSAAATANDWLAQNVELLAGDKVLATAEPDQKAAWFDFSAGPEGLEPLLDVAAIKEWVEVAGESEAESGRPAVHNVDGEGQLLREVDPGKSGTGVLDSDGVARKVAEAVTSGQGAAVPVEFGEVPPEVMKLTLPADDTLPYAPTAGEHWIEVDIPNATVTAYEGTEPVMVLPTVPGAAATPTVEGTFQVREKLVARDMSGFNVDGSPYFFEAVPYVLYFHGSYALHGAYWRDDFGTYQSETGSHGCLNLSPPAAKLLFEWAEVGDTVVSHS